MRQKDLTFGEELYNMLAKVLNSPSNRKVLDSIRGEYGVLWYLLKSGIPVGAGDLSEQLHVVPGRMTDILKSLEKKGYILREKDTKDRRMVKVRLLEAGRSAAIAHREQIGQNFSGLAEIFSEEEAKELLRLLNLLLTYKN